MIVLHMAERRGASAVEVVAPTIPDGVDQVLDVLESAGVVLDPSNNVLQGLAGRARLGPRPQPGARASRTRSTSWPRCAAAASRSPSETRPSPAGPSARRTVQLRVLVGAAGHPVRPAARRGPHRVAPPRRGATRLRREHQPRAEDPDRLREPARRGARPGRRRARSGAALRGPPLGRGEPPGPHHERGHRAVAACRRADALRPDVLVPIDEVVAEAVDQNRVVAAAKRIEIAVRGGDARPRSTATGRCWSSPCTTSSRTPSPYSQRGRSRRRRGEGRRRRRRDRGHRPGRRHRGESSSACSSASTASTRRARATPAAPASASASSSTPCRTTAATCVCGRSRAGGRPS